MRRANFDLGKKFILASLAVNIVQVVMIFLLIFSAGSRDNLNILSLPLYIIAASFAITSGCSVAILYFFINAKGEQKGMIDTINYLREQNKAIRAQRHDYLNHIQVIYGLLELQEYEEAQQYMEPVYKDIMKVNKALKTSEPAVNALLQAKMSIAEEKGIDMELAITSDLKALIMEPWEFCRIAGNLIDNSIYALEEKSRDKKLYIEIAEDPNFLELSVVNNGPKIPEAIMEHIFTEGFTTKGSKGQGMGLSIVESLVKDYRGRLQVDSTEHETRFSIELPKRG